jgi:hypothetical protein
MKLGTLIASLVLLGTACGVVPGAGSSRESARVSAQAVSSAGDDAGSDTDGTPPLAPVGPPLRSNDEPLGNPCGPSRCNIGEYCCNESCGLCAPRGGICLQRECGPATVPLAECADDSGCRTFSSYCDGCLCLPGAVLDPEPSCKATMVACILDPCHHQHAACVEGVCTIMDN